MCEAGFIYTTMHIPVTDDQHPDDRDLQNLDGDPQKDKESHLASYLPPGTCNCTPDCPYMMVNAP